MSSLNFILFRTKAIVFIVMGAPMLLYGLFAVYFGYQLQYLGTTCRATITDLQNSTVYYNYQAADGTPESGQCYVNDEFVHAHRVGGSVKIQYIPSRPDLSELADTGASLYNGLIEIGVGSVVFLIGFSRFLF